MRTMLVMVCLVALAAAQVATTGASLDGLRKKAEAGDAKAQVALARAYEKGEGVAQNDALAVKWYRAAAEQGDAEGQNNLGVMYRLGYGVEKDFAQARAWYAKAARQNHAPALFNLGAMYYNGDGVTVDDVAAYVYFTLAQEAGSKEAATAVQRMSSEWSAMRVTEVRLRMAELLEKGSEVPPDEARAAKVYEALAQAGNVTAQIRLAKMYLQGRGVTQDVNKTLEWCARAAKQQFTPGMVCMGFLYQSGRLQGGAKDAFPWYEKAAKNGNPLGMYSLGVLYAKGEGVKQDYPKAYLWFLRAAAGRVGLAVPAAEMLQAKIAKKEAEKVKKKVREGVLILSLSADLLEFGYVPKMEP